MTKDEVLKQALDALENGMKFVWSDPEREAGFVAIDAIKEALAQPEERYFCPRCGKRLGGMRITDAQWSNIHTCTPPVAADDGDFYGLPRDSVSTPNAGGKCVTDGETSPTKEIDPNQWAFDRGLEST
jgi:hypothetical protein